jgi:hypothetical protein
MLSFLYEPTNATNQRLDAARKKKLKTQGKKHKLIKTVLECKPKNPYANLTYRNLNQIEIIKNSLKTLIKNL